MQNRRSRASLAASLIALLVLALSSSAWSEPAESNGRFHALRLVPGQDLKIALCNFIEQREIQACAVVTCVGSLTQAHLRFADKPAGEVVEGPLEIQSLVGCGGDGTWHLHLSVADENGQMSGGHLLDGSIVRTTAEIVIVEMPQLEFQRVLDPQTGYPELTIKEKR
jgi:uncharacterized protein